MIPPCPTTSSSLCSSCACESESCIDTTNPNPGNGSTYHARATLIVSSLSKSIESKLPLSELDISPGSSPQLEDIQAETRKMPEETYQAFRHLVAIADSHQSKLQKLALKSKNNEPLLSSVLKEHQDSIDGGGAAIINEHRVCISEKIQFIDKTLDDLDLRIREAFDESEKTQRTLEQVKAVKDNVVPAVSNIIPILAPAESAGKVAVAIIACNLSSEFDNKLKELGLLDQNLRENVLIALQTRSILQDYMENNADAKTYWSVGCKKIYRVVEDGENVTAHSVEIVLERMAEFISPIKQYLVQINEYYGPGITVDREAKLFCNVVPKLDQYLNHIGSARVIIRRSHKYKYEKTVVELGLVIFERLTSMRIVFNQKPIDPQMTEQFVNPQAVKFIGDVKTRIHQLENMLNKHTSGSKIKDAEKKRRAGDRCYNNMEWRNRPPTDPGEVLAYLRALDAAVGNIHGMSMASLGRISATVDGQVERAHVNLTVTNPKLDDVHQTLNENVDKGMTRFREYKMEEKPSSRFYQLLEGLRSNHKAC